MIHDSTYVLGVNSHPMDEAFVVCKEHLNSEILISESPSVSSTFIDSPLLSGITVAFAVISILYIKRIAGLLPSLMACLFRSKETINLEDSVKLRRDKNAMAALMVVPFVLCMTSMEIWNPSFLQDMSIEIRFLILLGIFLFYHLFRIGVFHIIRPERLSNRNYGILNGIGYTFFLTSTFVILASSGICALFDVETELIKTIIYYVLGLTYFVFLIRKTQIFVKSCPVFSSILYLCALEILPTGILVAAATL
jgi:hypothetical protein